MKKLLFIDCCISAETHRTKRLCEAVLTALKEEYETERVALDGNKIEALSTKTLALRNERKAKNLHEAYYPEAATFARADAILIGAPYWDLSFPSALKAYIENIMVTGVTFTYQNDRPVGLCRAEHLYYVTTAGSYMDGNIFGFGYIAAIGKALGIHKSRQFAAEGLDLGGADSEAIMQRAEAEVRAYFARPFRKKPAESRGQT